jgi:hypothetical protein
MRRVLLAIAALASLPALAAAAPPESCEVKATGALKTRR